MGLKAKLHPILSTTDNVEKDAEPPREAFGSSGICNRIREATSVVEGLIKQCRGIRNLIHINSTIELI